MRSESFEAVLDTESAARSSAISTHLRPLPDTTSLEVLAARELAERLDSIDEIVPPPGVEPVYALDTYGECDGFLGFNPSEPMLPLQSTPVPARQSEVSDPAVHLPSSRQLTSRRFSQFLTVDLRRVGMVAGTAFSALTLFVVIATPNWSRAMHDSSDAQHATRRNPAGTPVRGTPPSRSPLNSNRTGASQPNTDSAPNSTEASQSTADGMNDEHDSANAQTDSLPRTANSSRPSSAASAASTNSTTASSNVMSSSTSATNRAGLNSTAEPSPSVPTVSPAEVGAVAPVDSREEARTKPPTGGVGLRTISSSRNGSPMNSAGSARAGYPTLRAAAQNSFYEIDRLTQALDSGARQGRDKADLLQQRALLYLNQGDNDRAQQDFRRAIDAYRERITRGDRVLDAREGLNAALRGAKQASGTIVY